MGIVKTHILCLMFSGISRRFVNEGWYYFVHSTNISYTIIMCQSLCYTLGRKWEVNKLQSVFNGIHFIYCLSFYLKLFAGNIWRVREIILFLVEK